MTLGPSGWLLPGSRLEELPASWSQVMGRGPTGPGIHRPGSSLPHGEGGLSAEGTAEAALLISYHLSASL